MTWFERARAWLLHRLRDHENATWLERRLGALFLKYAPYQLTCAEFERFVLDYYEGGLSERERSKFDFHMLICPMCDVHFQSYVKAVEMGQRLYHDEEAEELAELPEGLVTAIVDARRAVD